jgi:hypothetical protein
MDTNGKVFARFFANPKAAYMIEGDIGFDRELHDASQEDDFWIAIEAIYGKAYKRFEERLKLLTGKLCMALELRSQDALLDTPINDISSPDHPCGPKSERALKNAINEKRRSLRCQHSKNKIDTKRREADLKELDQFASKLKQRLLLKTISALWEELQKRSVRLRNVAIVTNKFTVAELSDPVALLHDSVANPATEVPSCYTPPEPEEGATSPSAGFTSVVINRALGIGDPDAEAQPN